MDLPEREPGGELAQTKPLSGPAPASAAIHRRCDQVMSLQELAPSWVAQHSVSYGHDLEIPTVFWGRDSRLGHELRLACLDPDGCLVRTRFVTNPIRARARSGAKGSGYGKPLQREKEDDSSRAGCVDLTGAFLWVLPCSPAQVSPPDVT